MCIHEITTAEVMTVISTLNNSAAGHDGIPAFIMKQCINDYITPLTHLINLSINEGTFPDELKIAKVIPLYKSDNEQSINNYRPISVLPFFRKIVVGSMIDVKKAFDGICHKTLLEKLYAYGIRGKLFNRVKSYLTNRTQ